MGRALIWPVMNNSNTPLPLVSVVLVEPIDDLNVGMVARAMRNLKFSDLRIVTKRYIDPKRVAITSREEGQIVFNNARFVSSLPEALADCEDVVGFSARDIKKNIFIGTTLSSWGAELCSARKTIKTAVMFGPEDTGLRNEHVTYCRSLVRIPAYSEYSSFNLAQAVLLCLYEISRDFFLQNENKQDEKSQSPPENNVNPDKQVGHPRAKLSSYDTLDSLVYNSMVSSGFLRVGTPAPIPGLVKMIFRRLELDEREMAILTGLFSKIVRSLKRKES